MQAVEICVKTATKISRKVCRTNKRIDFIFNKIESQKILKLEYYEKFNKLKHVLLESFIFVFLNRKI